MKTYPLPIHVHRFFTDRLAMQTPRQLKHGSELPRHLPSAAEIRVGSAQKAANPSFSSPIIDADLIGDFLTFVETRRGKGARSRNTRLSAIRSCSSM